MPIPSGLYRIRKTGIISDDDVVRKMGAYRTRQRILEEMRGIAVPRIRVLTPEMINRAYEERQERLTQQASTQIIPQEETEQPIMRIVMILHGRVRVALDMQDVMIAIEDGTLNIE